MNYSYIIIDDNQENVFETKAIADGFSELVFVASANNYNDGLNLILEHSPKLIFLEIDPANKESNLSLALINELYRYLKVIPKIIVTTSKKDLAFESIQYEVVDYFLKPVRRIDLIKSILKLNKSTGEESNFITPALVIDKRPSIAVELKSTEPAVIEILNEEQNLDETIESEISEISNEEQAIEEIIEPEDSEFSSEEQNPDEKIETETQEISNIEQDTEEIIEPEDIEIETTEEVSEESKSTQAQQKGISNIEQPLVICIKSYGDYRYIDANDICYFQADNNSTDIHLNNGEMVTAFKTLKHFEGILTFPFIRIHNSYILNRNYISRIHTGNAVCYIKNSTTKIPFSKSYKANVDLVISEFSNGNYLEI